MSLRFETYQNYQQLSELSHNQISDARNKIGNLQNRIFLQRQEVFDCDVDKRNETCNHVSYGNNEFEDRDKSKLIATLEIWKLEVSGKRNKIDNFSIG